MWQVPSGFGRPSTRVWSLWLEGGFGVAGLTWLLGPSTRVLALGDCGVWLLLGIVVAWLYWLAVRSVSLGEGLHMLDYGFSPICCGSMSIKDQSES